MTIPSTAYAVVVFLIMVLPGIVFGVVRAAVAGHRPHDREWGTRALQAILFSVILDAVYLIILGDAAVSRIARGGDTLTKEPRLVASAVLGFAVLVPAVLAYITYGQLRWRTLSLGRLRVKLPLRRTTFSPVPTAWDQVAATLDARWVRIRLADGRWVGGWFGTSSAVSTYPEPRDIFIEDQHHIGPDGSIGEQVSGTAGVWVSLADGDIVEWLQPIQSPSTEETPTCQSGPSAASHA